MSASSFGIQVDKQFRNSRRGKNLEQSLNTMGEDADKGHVGRFLENDPMMRAMSWPGNL